MAVSKTLVKEDLEVTITFVDDAGGGGAQIVKLGDYAVNASVQRTSGAGTYTVEGSNDGVTFGALPTAIAAANDAVCKPITGFPKFISVTVAAAAATVIVHGVRTA